MSESDEPRATCALLDLTLTFSVAFGLVILLVGAFAVEVGLAVGAATTTAVGFNIVARRAWPTIFNPRLS